MALNGISTATSSTSVLTKLYRKGLKLEAAALKRQGYTLNANGTIADDVVSRPTTTSAASYSDGATMNTFRVLNRGGNWDEFFANWTNGTWSCVQFPGSVVTNMVNPGDDSPEITITGGEFVNTQFYQFTGNVLTAGTASTSTYGYRALNIVDGTHVAFVGTTTTTVIGSASPTVGHPWTSTPPSPVDQYGFFEEQLDGGTYLDFDYTIGGQSLKFICTNFNGNPPYGSYIKVNGVLVAGDQRGLAPDGVDTTLAPFHMTRGHTIIVLNPSTGTMRAGYPKVYDTYGTPGLCATMKTDLQAVATGDLVAIGTYDATSCTQDLRDALTNYFGANTYTNTWTANRISQMFLGIRNTTP